MILLTICVEMSRLYRCYNVAQFIETRQENRSLVDFKSSNGVGGKMAQIMQRRILRVLCGLGLASFDPANTVEQHRLYNVDLVRLCLLPHPLRTSTYCPCPFDHTSARWGVEAEAEGFPRFSKAGVGILCDRKWSDVFAMYSCFNFADSDLYIFTVSCKVSKASLPSDMQ
jgi:hypothetical protein